MSEPRAIAKFHSIPLLAKCSKSTYPCYLLRASFFSHQAKLPLGETKKALSERMPGYIVKKDATHARLVDVSPHDLRHRFGYRMAKSFPPHRLAQIMGYDSLDTTKLYIQGIRHELQQVVETIAWT